MFCKRCVYIFKSPRCNLGLFWTFGLLLGGYVAESAPFISTSLILAAVDSVSIVRLFYVTILPFAITLLLALSTTKRFVYPLAIAKSFIYAYCSIILIRIFSGYGWLIKSLLLFSDSISVIMLLLVWGKIIQDSISRMDWLLIVATVCISCVVDYYIVMPYLALLFNH